MTLGVLAAVAAAAGAVFFGHAGSGAAGSRCLSYDTPGVLGGGTWHLCGDDAASFCRAHHAESATLTAKCDALRATG